MLKITPRKKQDTADQGTLRQRLGLGGALAGDPSPNRSRDDTPTEDAPERETLRQRLRQKVGEGSDPEGLTTRWTTKDRLVKQGLLIGITTALAIGPAHLIYDAAFAPEPVQQAQSSSGYDPAMTSRRLVASDTAVRWVQTWATATQGDAEEVEKQWSGTQQLVLPKKASTIAEARVVDAVASAPGVWSVTVSALVTDPDADPARRYYRVPVQVSGEEPGQIKASPQAVPAIVPGPRAVREVEHGRYNGIVATGSEAGVTITQFLSALLAGGGGIDRYTTPGSHISAVPRSAQYDSLEVTSIRTSEGNETDWQDNPKDGDTVEVMVDAVVTTGKGDSLTQRSVAYPLLLTARDGRWEITSIEPALAGATDTPTKRSGTPARPEGEN